MDTTNLNQMRKLKYQVLKKQRQHKANSEKAVSREKQSLVERVAKEKKVRDATIASRTNVVKNPFLSAPGRFAAILISVLMLAFWAHYFLFSGEKNDSGKSSLDKIIPAGNPEKVFSAELFVNRILKEYRNGGVEAVYPLWTHGIPPFMKENTLQTLKRLRHSEGLEIGDVLKDKRVNCYFVRGKTRNEDHFVFRIREAEKGFRLVSAD